MDHKKKGDGEKDHDPKTQPKFGAVVAQMVLCSAFHKVNVCKKQNEGNRKEENRPEDNPEERTSVMYP